MEREQGQQVVEEADPGGDPGASATVEIDRHPKGGLARRAEDESGAGGRRLGLGAERRQDQVVLGRKANRDADGVREAADDEALGLEPVCDRRVGADEDEVCIRLRDVEADGGERATHPFALGDRLLDVEPGIAQGGRGDPGGRAETGAGSRRRSSSRATFGEATAYPTRSAASPNAFESVRIATRFGARSISGTTPAPPPYSTYASSTTTAASGWDRARSAICSDRRARRSGCSGCRPRSGRRRPAPRSPRLPRSRTRSHTAGRSAS